MKTLLHETKAGINGIVFKGREYLHSFSEAMLHTKDDWVYAGLCLGMFTSLVAMAVIFYK